jgi:DNA invertase Pin-like site-specific DNA recombinase
MRTLTTRIFPAQAAESARQAGSDKAYCKIWAKDGRTRDEVLRIRGDKRSRKEIAREFGCSVATIARIQKRETYNVYP